MKWLKTIALCSLFIMTFNLPIAQAQVDSSTDQILEQILQLIQQVTAYYGIDLSQKAPAFGTPDLTQIEAEDQDATQNFQNSTELSVSPDQSSPIDYPMPTQAISLTEQQIQTILNLINLATINNVQNYMANQVGISNPYPASQGSNQPAVQPNNNDNSLNMESLLSPLTYSTSQTSQKSTNSKDYSASQGQTESQQALNFIRFATGQAQPIIPYLSSAFMRLSPKDQMNYLNSLRTYAALFSVAASNLNQIYGRRLPSISVSGTQESQLQVEANMAMRRLTQGNGSWQQEMEKAPPATIMRETLYLLAEMNYQLYQQRVANERLLATATAIQLQGLQMMKQTISSPGS